MHRKKAGEKRKNHNNRFKNIKNLPDVKIQTLDLWKDMRDDILELIVDAEADNDQQDLALLYAARDELAAARADLLENPSEWDQNRIMICQRRIKHLLLGVNPFTTDPSDWEV